jgi:hypothetical protein
MKKLVLLIALLAFLTTSCYVKKQKDNNIHVDYSREKDQFKTSKKDYKSPKKCKKWK